MASDKGKVRVLLGNSHQTSGGTGPGVVEVPADEAARIVANRHGRILGPGEEPDDLGATRRIRHGVTN
jgi:hypothetical protein